MPKTTKSGKAKSDELPSPVARSSAKAQRTFAKTYDSAMETYDGDPGRASATAYAALKHGYEKVGDHWEAKDANGPSDSRAEQQGPGDQRTAGGVDANATKKHLMELARRLDVPGRSTMSKGELVQALQKASKRANAKARQS